MTEKSERVPTTVLCDARLKELAYAAGIVLSTTLEDALRVKLSLVNDTPEDTALKVRELEAQIAYLNSSERAAELKAVADKKANEVIERKNDTVTLRHGFVKFINNDISSAAWNALLHGYAEKYSMDFAAVVALARSKE